MGAQNIGSWNHLELLQNQFSQKEVLYGNGRDFQNFKLPPFMFSIIVREVDITNEPILERRRITLKVCIKNFLIMTKNSFPDPLKVEFSRKNRQKSVEIELYWGLGTGLGQNKKIFDIDL